MIALASGLSCPGGGGGIGGGGDGTGGLNPVPPPGNRPPRVFVTSISATNIPPGGNVQIGISAQDAEDTSVTRVFASLYPDPAVAQEIPIQSGIAFDAPGGSTVVYWDTSVGNVPLGNYYLFAEISDGVNAPVRAVGATQVAIAPQPAPDITVIAPQVNLGVSIQDDVTIRYVYADTFRNVRVTLLLDKGHNASPFDPGNPAANPDLIVLPSTTPLPGDPTFPSIDDTAQIRTNPRLLPATTVGNEPIIEYRFTINTTQIPQLDPPQPYFIRAHITDESGNNPVTAYATGSVTIVPSLASGTVDVSNIGSTYAGTRFLGFIQFENLGSSFLKADSSTSNDMDNDGASEFMIVSRFGRPKNRPGGPGAAYLVFGRRAKPFPADTDGNGIPDGFSAAPSFLPNPYDAANIGRFGGTQSINSIGRFYRGALYGMPISMPFVSPHTIGSPDFPGALFKYLPQFGATGQYSPWPDRLVKDLLLPNPNFSNTSVFNIDPQLTAGLTSVTRLDVVGDGNADFVFGLPMVAANDFLEFDPAKAGCKQGTMPGVQNPPALAYDHVPMQPFSAYVIDTDPNAELTTSEGDDPPPRIAGNHDLGPVPQGMAIAVDGTTNLNTSAFQSFIDAGLAGQFDPGRVQTDEGLIFFAPFKDANGVPTSVVPNGARFRGGWLDGGAPISSFSEFGATVATVPNLDPAFSGHQLLTCSPGAANARGRVRIWAAERYDLASVGADGVQSIPGYQVCPTRDEVPDVLPAIVAPTCYQEMIPAGPMGMPPARTDKWACRRRILEPASSAITGEDSNDFLGNAGSAGQFNDDGVPDLLMGAPGYPGDIQHNNYNAGRVYFLFMPTGGQIFPSAISDIPRAYITGKHVFLDSDHPGDQFGNVQSAIGDMNADGIDDVVFASEFFPGSLSPSGATSQCSSPTLPSSPAGAGYVGVIFGNRPLTGENGFIPDDVGTPCLEGVVFLGTQQNGHAGHQVASAGDFNGDGFGDLLISAPGERRTVNGQSRLGVVYLIFGGPHLNRHSPETRKLFTLDQVGTSALPGIVFIGRAFADDPITDPTGDRHAALETVGGLGDIDGDGFDDIAIGVPHMDFVDDPNAPTQRRIGAGEVYIVYGSSYGTNTLP